MNTNNESTLPEAIEREQRIYHRRGVVDGAEAMLRALVALGAASRELDEYRNQLEAWRDYPDAFPFDMPDFDRKRIVAELRAHGILTGLLPVLPGPSDDRDHGHGAPDGEELAGVA